MRSDPERARDLLVGFAEFTRCTFREHSQYTTLAEELRLVDTYLELERARFGDRLAVILRVAPEVLPVRVPSLVLQPLVENAIRHGLEQLAGSARLQIIAAGRLDTKPSSRSRTTVRVSTRGSLKTFSPGGRAATPLGSATSTSVFGPLSAGTTG